MKKRRPVCYAIRQEGLREYIEISLTKREAVQLARDCLWWSTKVTITPLYAGKPLRWISKREANRRAGKAL